jgi:hypothetical protein
MCLRQFWHIVRSVTLDGSNIFIMDLRFLRFSILDERYYLVNLHAICKSHVLDVLLLLLHHLHTSGVYKASLIFIHEYLFYLIFEKLFIYLFNIVKCVHLIKNQVIKIWKPACIIPFFGRHRRNSTRVGRYE